MPIPPILYKYCKANAALKFLNSRSLRFTNPAEFNDPFEFLPCHDPLANHSDADFNDECLDLVFDLAQACPNGACCFSAAPDNLLLWSHYADSHKGIVIGFDTANPFFRDRLFPVTYSWQRIQIELERRESPDKAKSTLSWQPSEAGYQAVLTTKSSHWEYECEWRLIRNLSECTATTDGHWKTD